MNAKRRSFISKKAVNVGRDLCLPNNHIIVADDFELTLAELLALLVDAERVEQAQRCDMLMCPFEERVKKALEIIDDGDSDLAMQDVAAILRGQR